MLALSVSAKATSRLVMGGRRGRSSRRRVRLASNRIRLHQLDARSIGIVDIYLALLVDASGNLELFAIGLEGRAGLKNRDGFRNIRYHQRDVIFRAELIGRIAIEHELNIIIPIGNLHVDPAQLLRIRASAPRLFETQHVPVKLNRLLAIPDQKSQMVDLGGDARFRLEFASRLCFKTIRKSLYKLDQHSIWVLDLECIVARAGLSVIAGFHIKSPGSQVGTHRFNVVDRKAEVTHHVGWMSWRLVEE